jgi:hypothetical protein
MNKSTLSIEDWMMMRILYHAIRSNPEQMQTEPDIAFALDYLLAKYPMQDMQKYLEQIKNTQTRSDK